MTPAPASATGDSQHAVARTRRPLRRPPRSGRPRHPHRATPLRRVSAARRSSARRSPPTPAAGAIPPPLSATPGSAATLAAPAPRSRAPPGPPTRPQATTSATPSSSASRQRMRVARTRRPPQRPPGRPGATSAPSDTTLPSISGDAIVGSTLTADPGSWSDPSAAFSYAWQRCDASGACTTIEGATRATYTPTGDDLGDTIIVSVTAANAGGQNAATSAATARSAGRPPPRRAIPPCRASAVTPSSARRSPPTPAAGPIPPPPSATPGSAATPPAPAPRSRAPPGPPTRPQATTSATPSSSASRQRMRVARTRRPPQRPPRSGSRTGAAKRCTRPVSAAARYCRWLGLADETVVGRRAAAALLVILVAGLSGVGVLLFHDLCQRERGAVAGHLRVTLEVALTEIANEAAQAQQQASSLATRPSLQQALARADVRSLARMTADVRGAAAVPAGRRPLAASALTLQREVRVLAAGKLLGIVTVAVPLDGALLSQLRSHAPLRPGEGFLLVHGDQIAAAPAGMSGTRLSASKESVRLRGGSYLVSQATIVRGPQPIRLAALAPRPRSMGQSLARLFC